MFIEWCGDLSVDELFSFSLHFCCVVFKVSLIGRKEQLHEGQVCQYVRSDDLLSSFAFWLSVRSTGIRSRALTA